MVNVKKKKSKLGLWVSYVVASLIVYIIYSIPFGFDPKGWSTGISITWVILEFLVLIGLGRALKDL